MLKAPRLYKKVYDHVVYAVPAFSNPSGRTMSLRRRQQLVGLARNHNALVITDDVYDFLQWQTSRKTDAYSKSPSRAILPRLTDIDRALPPHPLDPHHFGHTMSNGSFSKVLGPGIRTGWAEATPAFAFGLSQCGSSRSGGCPSQLAATMVALLLQNSTLQQHISTVLIPAYVRRWAKMMETIERHLVPLGVSVTKVSLEGYEVFGGYFIWFQLPRPMIAERIAEIAKERENLVIAHGGMFEVYGDEEAAMFRRWIRVCFAWEDEEKLVEGIKRLARVVVDVLENGCECKEGGNKVESQELPIGEF
jgi:DNA-binding transcriptional MocR family regulator